VDSRWGPRADPINAALAAEGIRALHRALPAIKAGVQAKLVLAKPPVLPRGFAIPTQTSSKRPHTRATAVLSFTL